MLGRRGRLLLLIVAPFAAYASALGNGFVWDDHQTIEHGLYIDSLANVPRLFSHDTMWNSDGGRFASRARIATYRPLTMTTFFVENALWGARPWAYHLGSLLLHLVNVLLLYRLGRRLLGDGGGAFVGALLFAVHPAISEGIHWINGRSDPLCTLFFLAALDAWCSAPLAEKRLLFRGAAVAALFFAATLCKETAFFLGPTVLLLLDHFGLRGRRAAKALFPWLVGGALGLGARLASLSRVGVGTGLAQIEFALARLPLILLEAARVLVLPEAAMEPSLAERYRILSSGKFALGCALFMGLFALALWRRRRKAPLLGMALAAFVLTLAPVALLTVVPDWSGWGRYLYPSAPLVALALGEAIERITPDLSAWARRFGQVAIAALALLCAGKTFAAGAAWQDDRAFYRAQIADRPEVARAWFELAFLEAREGHLEVARPLIERAVDIAPQQMPFPWSRAAMLLWRLGDRPRTLLLAGRALERNPDDPDARSLHDAALGDPPSRNDSPSVAPAAGTP